LVVCGLEHRHRTPCARHPAEQQTPGIGTGPLVTLAIDAGLARAAITTEATFSWSAWLWGLAPMSLFIAAVWFSLNLGRPAHLPRLSASLWLVLFWWAALVPTLLYALWWVPGARGLLPEAISREGRLNWAVYIGVWLWLLAILWRTSRRVGASRVRASFLATTVLGALLLSTWWLDSSPWRAVEPESSEPPPRLRLSQETFEQQQVLLAGALERIAVRPATPVQVFGIVYAPHEESVFMREAQLVERVMRERLGADGRTLTLLNHPSTVAHTPWATPRNLRSAIAAVAQRMDRERDVLVLYLTSHGGKDHRLVAQLWPLDVAPLEAADVKAWLDEHGIRHRAVIVSACYSGGWIAPLADDHTLVMTASAADRTAYGCGEDSPLTYFGEALFQHGLAQTRSLEQAFGLAAPRIASMERTAGLSETPSLPQLHVGPRFRERWSEWLRAIEPARQRP